MQISVPVGCEGTVYIPVQIDKNILESGKPVSESADVQFLKEENDYLVYKVLSGKFEFLSL